MEQTPNILKRIVYKAPGHAPKVMHVDYKYKCHLKKMVANADIVESVPMMPTIVEGSPVQICVDEDGHPIQAFLVFNLTQAIGNTAAHTCIIDVNIDQPVIIRVSCCKFLICSDNNAGCNHQILFRATMFKHKVAIDKSLEHSKFGRNSPRGEALMCL